MKGVNSQAEETGLGAVVLYWAGCRANRLGLLGQESHLWVAHLTCLHLGGDTWLCSAWVEPEVVLTH